MRKLEPIQWQEIWRVRRDGPREPLRTVKELAEIHGMHWQTLGKMLQEAGAPEIAINNTRQNVAHKAKWYRPSQVAQWLKQRGQK
jgi:hypothetical protein